MVMLLLMYAMYKRISGHQIRTIIRCYNCLFLNHFQSFSHGKSRQLWQQSTINEFYLFS